MDREDDDRIIAMHREKYGPPDAGAPLPPSMQKGSDRLPFFWFAYFAVFGLLALYFGVKSGG